MNYDNQKLAANYHKQSEICTVGNKLTYKWRVTPEIRELRYEKRSTLHQKYVQDVTECIEWRPIEICLTLEELYKE